MRPQSLAYQNLVSDQLRNIVLFKDLVQEIMGMAARSEPEVEQAIFKASCYCNRSPLDIAIVTKEFLFYLFDQPTGGNA